jgi:hypothetical protein
MNHTWTIIFVIIIVIAFGIAAWHDHEEMKRRERRTAAHEKVERTED